MDQKRRKILLGLGGIAGISSLGLGNCQVGPPTGSTSIDPPPNPKPPPPPTIPPSFPPPGPLIDYPIRALSGFALGLRNRGQILDFVNSAREHGFNMVRVGSETSRWTGGGFFGNLQGPFPGSPDKPNQEWVDNLQRVIETCAEGGMAIELVASFTVKHTESAEWHFDYVNLIGEIVLPWDHIFLSVMNEPCCHTRLGARKIINMLVKELRRYGKPVTVDWPGPPWVWPYTNLVTMHAYHPRRNWPNPGDTVPRRSLQKAMNAHGQVFFDELTAMLMDDDPAYDEFIGRSTVAYGTEEQRKNQIQREITDIISVGAFPTFHEFRGMAGYPARWYPRLSE